MHVFGHSVTVSFKTRDPGFDVLPTDDPKSVDAEREEMREKWLAFDCVAEVVVLDEPGLRMAWWSLLGESAMVFSDRSGPQNILASVPRQSGPSSPTA